MTYAWRHTVAFVLCVALTTSARAVDAPVEPKGRITGRVTVAGTGAPVARAKVPITVGADKEWPGLQYEVVEVITDNDGHYSADVPLGNAWISPVEVPAGYWYRVPGLQDAITSREEPMFEKNFEVQIGGSWPVRVMLESGQPLTGGTVYVGESEKHGYGKATPDGDGKTLLPIPAEGGKLQLASYSDQLIVPSGIIKLSVEPNFDPNAVAKISKTEGEATFEAVDKAGRKATVEGTKVVLVDGKAELQIIVRKPTPAELGTLVGKVVDDQGKPLTDARVEFQGAVLPQFTGGRTRTNGDGEFRIENIMGSGFAGRPPDFRLVVTRDGYAGVENAQQRFQPDANGIEKLDQPVVLKPGYSARIRVLGNAGKPVEGAWVMPAGDMAVGAQFTKTNAEGEATLRDLPEGFQPIRILFGTQGTSTRVAISRRQLDDITTIRLRPPAPDTAEVTNRPKPVPLKAGEEAPEWTVAEWTDGKARKLSDFRGKVVVMDFWGVWCSPCINSIPAKKRIQEKYRDKDIVFIGMHTAGTDMSQIKSLLELKEWNLLTGIEQGTDQIDSATSRRYGIHIYPTMVIVDRNGRISTNTNDDESIGDKEKVMAKAEVIAKEAGLPWPIREDWPEEKIHDWFLKMNEYRLSKEIDKALAKE